ncbi:LuxR C-terminal-related transcriptional regulator [Pseudomonas turukhanskensis]|uniref:Helix-turn-helix transcriptional regulator n=1 Tax=Pseudomonas turukhanskensis TaxID=1806536 RepID=A0A9W6NEI0_9PSED|nr:LuxR C-terminal-related transcriptional regulator [Pseudomonas turukhanskensis]GLK87792.1 helix-turn-helix transcriptional regulator [Pseudomonas turukhanskensis]
MHNVHAIGPRPLRLSDSPLPRLPAAHFPRPRLVQALLAGDSRLALICAPAGFGKSVLLNECVRQAPVGTQVVWLDLLGRALTPVELLKRLAKALGRPVEEGDTYDELCSLLSRSETPLWIVLDDYPRDPCAELDDCLDRLLEQAPHTLRWWIGGRRRPAWNLPRLMLQGDLLELDAPALALDEPELNGLLQQHHLELSPELSEQLLHNSEGWVAGVCLLLIKGTAENLPERLASGTPLLNEYIAREVLSGLSPTLLRALSLLAHMPRFSSALCEHVLDEGGAALFEELHARQMFFLGMDSCGEWFRLSRPVAAVLKRQCSAPAPTQAHVRACQWFASHGDVRAAVEHALFANQPDVAANYLQRFGQEQLLVGQSVSQFLQWRHELPASLYSSTPRLITLQAWALLICARLDEVDDCLEDLGRFFPQPSLRQQQQLLAHYQAIQSVLQRQRGQRSAREQALQALDALFDDAWSQRALCYQVLAQQAFSENLLSDAQDYIQEGLKLARLKGSVLFEALLSVDRIHQLTILGETGPALELAELCLQHLQSAGRQGPVLGRLLLLRGSLLASQGHTEAAHASYSAGLHAAEACEDAYIIFGYQGLAELAAQANDFTLAFQLLRKAERLMQWQHVPEVRYRGVLQLAQATLWLRQGEAQRARAALLATLESYQQRDLLAPSGFYDLLPRLRYNLALADLQLGDVRSALDSLHTLSADCERSGYFNLLNRCRFSLVQALLASGQEKNAEAMLRLALETAQQQGVSPELQALHGQFGQWLEQVLPQLAEPLELRILLNQAGAGVPPSPESSPLSAREKMVLEQIALGYSNLQIADRLHISLHTVKTHARRINVKLGVERRTQAVARAKTLGWLM